MKIFLQQLGIEKKYEIKIDENALGKELLEKIENILGDYRVRFAISDEKGHRSLNLYLSKTMKELGIKEGATLTKIGFFVVVAVHLELKQLKMLIQKNIKKE